MKYSLRHVRALGDAASQAFLSPARWHGSHLGDSGYRVEEFTVSGEARLYIDGCTDGASRPPRHGRTVPYTSRVLTVRPLRDEDFSGEVHIELLNPSTGNDFPMYWPDTARHLVRRGAAYAGVTCKSVTAHALRDMPGGRYSALSFPHDGAVWDLVGAVAAACRRPEAAGLLPGLRRPDRTLLTGWSQSGSFLRTYLCEGLHDLHSSELGQEICDAYLIGVSSGGFGPYGYVNVDRDGEVDFDERLRPVTPLAQVAMDDPRRVVRGSRVPVIEFMSQEEAVSHLWHQRADSDVAGDLYRCYQIPARGHESGLLDDAARIDDHRAAGTAPAEGGPRHAATAYLLAAAIDNLLAWTDGTPPPRADPISLRVAPGFERDPQGVDYSGVSCVTDEAGHAMGGVRYLDVEVPVRRMAADPDGPIAMGDWTHTPFDRARLRRRYGSPEELRERARRAVAGLVAGRWYLPEDAAAAVDELCRGVPSPWG